MIVTTIDLLRSSENGALEQMHSRVQEWLHSEPVKVLARATGLKARTLQSWRDGDTSPNMDNLGVLGAYFGDVFINDMFAPVMIDPPNLMSRMKQARTLIDLNVKELENAEREAAAQVDSHLGGGVAPRMSRTSQHPRRQTSGAKRLGRIAGLVVMLVAVLSSLTIDDAMRAGRPARPVRARASISRVLRTKS